MTGVECLEVETFSFDEDGRPEIETIAGSEHTIEADTVIFAIGQLPDLPEGFGLDITDRRLIALSEFDLSTSREGVFAAGDAVTGTGSVIKAIASGRKAAAAVDKYLGGSGRLDRKLAPRRSSRTPASAGWRASPLCPGRAAPACCPASGSPASARWSAAWTKARRAGSPSAACAAT